ncbi:MAG: hypothetical protein A2945_05015 [Candidatus Liptonbacteria bacterium RIFCSPLOWO2_01_FULL_52_25]|uniref:Uncharacterized protein n=1 Tax=Candidatus Liptonbacteria bacterium RIFCSPLOWO2_01_FULL_52_25 TaxID=1798650 RepID=A0A1G2CEY6_9BACT|nr:MAG: hypothetical protein A2945_05015 [Candidatus Liptonbacteria bacterium RIFCSPLOWO2_01_FULL_52_25]
MKLRRGLSFAFLALILGVSLMATGNALSPPSRIMVTYPTYLIAEAETLEFHENGQKGVLKYALPDNILDQLVGMIIFAFEKGAMRGIGIKDLDHAHLLIWPDRKERNFENLDGILIHTQEMVPYSRVAYQKRNIVAWPGGRIEILPCTMSESSHLTEDIGGMRVPHCTIYASGLGMDVFATLFIIGIDHVHPAFLRGYERNIRVIHGHKILFGITENSGDPFLNQPTQQ